MVRVVFVCLGNICRSPTAEGVMRHIVESARLDAAIEIDSAGTGAWHAGEPPDRRATLAAKKRGIRLAGRARQFRERDWVEFDYVLAMDQQNRRDLAALAPNLEARAKLHLLLDFAVSAEQGASVPDPYYGGDAGFERVLDLCDAGCRGLLDDIKRRHGLG